MQRLVVILLALAAIALGGTGAPQRAQAGVIPAASLGAVVNETGLAQPVRYVCRRVWRCNRWGCGWRRACFWRPGPYYGPRVGFYGPRFGVFVGPRPYYRCRWTRWGRRCW